VFVERDPDYGAARDRDGITFDEACEVRRIALNMDQIKKYNPPPNPAKTTDGRAKKYIARFGHESWELDALSPKVLAGLVRSRVQGLVSDEALMEAQAKKERDGQNSIRSLAEEHL
jgi:hypothetical protein